LKPNISEWQLKYRKEVFEIKFKPADFELINSVKECFYCKISLDEIKELRIKEKLFKKNERGYNLELDRKLPNREYSVGNCVMACYWCNNAKTDEFTAEEFKPIGELIGQTLKARLK
jgi:5-methylcytosine-specific restriction endonuclease McrA